MNPDLASSHLLIVTPVKDEIDSIEAMVESVLRQTVPFQEWVILDDGSTDGTGEFLRGLAASMASITLVQTDAKTDRALGRHVSALVEHGLELAKLKHWRFWAKIDADLVLASDYFERILESFVADPTLGIASGRSMLRDSSGAWRNEWTPDFFPLGMARVYRRACWLDIGGYSGDRQFDVLDVYSARRQGWRTARIAETDVRLLRRIDARMPGQLRRRFDAGSDLYAMGYHPAYFLLRAIRSMWDEKPLALAGSAMMCGYLCGAILRRRWVSDELFRFVRREQRSLLTADRIVQYLRLRIGRHEASADE